MIKIINLEKFKYQLPHFVEHSYSDTIKNYCMLKIVQYYKSNYISDHIKTINIMLGRMAVHVEMLNIL